MEPDVNRPPQANRHRTAIGIALIALGGSCNAVGIGLTVAPRRDGDPSAGIFWIVVSIVAMIGPGILLVLAGRRAARRAKQLDTIAALASASQRISFAVLATDLQVTQTVARALLLEAIAAGRIVGRLDLDAGAFISGSTHGGVQQVEMVCRNCGGRSRVIVSMSAPSLCSYCGFRLA